MNDVNLMDLMQDYDTDQECRAALEGLRWPDGVTCPRCEGDHIRRTESRKQYDCGSCGYQFSVTVGTVLQDSKLPLPKWFAAVYLMCEARKGISANQLKRTLGVTYKTAWFLTHRIRKAMGAVQQAPLSGTVEVDETLVGGKGTQTERDAKGFYRRGPIMDNKATVIGAIARNGEVRLKMVPDRRKRTVHAFIRKHVADEAEAIYTDELRSYNDLADADTRHETVRHSAKEYVRGEVHTNSIENVWSLLHRSITGSYHKLSAKHLPAYLDEIEWRFNNRANPYLFRDTLTALLTAEPLEYRNLVGTSATASSR